LRQNYKLKKKNKTMKKINSDYKILETNLKDSSDEDILWTSLQKIIDIEYSKIVGVFGQPSKCIDEYSKVDAQWVIMTPVGIATIYNYKDGKNYLGDEGKEVRNITEWHIGGYRKEVVDYIVKVLGLNKRSEKKKKYNVIFKWEKYIDFGLIEAKSKLEAKNIAEEKLNNDNNLIEEDGVEKWEIKKDK